MKIPIPRPLQPKNSSGTLIRRMRTKTVESAPSAMITRLSGTVAGSSIPDSLSATSASTASPMKKTSFPSAPVCQPITLVVGPSPDPTYQPVNAERASTSPETQVSWWPQPQICSNEREGRGCGATSQSSSSGAGGRYGSGVSSGVCKLEVEEGVRADTLGTLG